MTRIIGVITGENYNCTISEDDDGRVYFIADADIDADGANGQNGSPAAYMVDNSGSEDLANGGMTIANGKVVCAKEWARDIVILDDDDEPKVFDGGIIASMTWYRDPTKSPNDPRAYVDAETVPYIVVPPIIISATQGIVRGCKGRVTYNDLSVECVVADQGPRNKIGELSIAAARAVGIPSSPRVGGSNEPNVYYELWPGIAAEGYQLIPA
jgi:Fungal chitosanase of glycosyl hydrolase group 75